MLISVSGTENDDIFNGYAYVEAEGEEVVDIEIENLTTVDDKFVGKLTITSEALNDINTGLGMANLTIVGRVENGYEELIIGVGSGEAQLISLTIGGTEHAPKVAQPHSNTVSDPDDWSAEFDTDKLQEAFEDSGLLEVIQSIAQVYYENMYGDFYDDYYDYYYDDYDDSYFEDDGDIYAYSDEYDNGYLAGYADGLADGADGDYLNSYDFSADENGDAYYEGYDAGYEEGFDEAFDQ